MHPLNRTLRETFHFSSRDLLANRAGKLSERQQARQSALAAGLKIAIAAFVVVMLGSLGVVFLMSTATGSNEGASRFDTLIGAGVLIGVFALILVVSLFSSQKYLAAAREKHIQKAEGQASHGKIREDAGHFPIKIGRTTIRLLTQEQLDSFRVGESYRLYFLPGPVPTILSAEVIGTETEAEQTLEPADSIEDDVIIQRQKRGRSIVAVLAILTLVIPLGMLAGSMLPAPFSAIIFLGLFLISIGFVAWALRRVG